MNGDRAISAAVSCLNWIVLRWRTVGCPTKCEKILPLKYLCVATGIDPIWTSTWPGLPQQSAYHWKVHKARSGHQVTSCLEKSPKEKVESKAAMFCKTMATTENDHHWCLCSAGYWTGHELNFLHYSQLTMLRSVLHQRAPGRWEAAGFTNVPRPLAASSKPLSVDSVQHGCTQCIFSFWCASLNAKVTPFSFLFWQPLNASHCHLWPVALAAP